MQNIEIKYKISEPEGLRNRLSENPVIRFLYRHHQKDIYFNAPQGRVKIRLEETKQPCLIEYYRSDESKPRISDYTLTPLENVENTLQQLRANLGILAVVEKWRELFFYKNVRIHLDEVETLGWFVEFESVISEAVAKTIAQKNLEEILAALQDLFDETLSTGYLNLLLEKQNPPGTFIFRRFSL